MLPRVLAAAAAALLFTGCGYIGDPLPPLANVPVRVTDLAAVQRGSRIIVHFTIPDKTTEGYPVPQPVTLDLRGGTGGDHFDENEWASRARHIPAPEIEGPLATYEIATADWAGKEIVLAAKVIAGNGKQTGWSNFVVVPVVPAPPVPSNVAATATAQGVRVTWGGPGGSFRVLRKAEGGEFSPADTVTRPEWTDTTAEYGKRYSYMVQSLVDLGQGRQAESDLSKEIEITPEDKFPPAIPSGLRADPAPASVELAWDRNTESDIAGYRIYRAAGNGPLEKLAEVTQLPAYSDRAVTHGVTYRYAVTSVDRTGNESARSGIVEAAW